MRTDVLIRGAGEIGSALAWLLFREGYAVVLAESTEAVTTRRLMAFADAVFDGSCELQGVRAVRVESAGAARAVLGAGRDLPLFAGEASPLLAELRPSALVDARLRKRASPERQLGLAPLVVGLGPGFEAGRDCDLVVETAHGPRLGEVIVSGPAMAYDGLPQEIEGTRRERHVRAEHAGVFRTSLRIGGAIEAGAVVGAVDGTPHRAGIAGLLRGLARDGVSVAAGTRLAEVLPPGASVPVAGIAERPRRIAEGVHRALRERCILPTAGRSAGRSGGGDV